MALHGQSEGKHATLPNLAYDFDPATHQFNQPLTNR